MVSRQDVLSYVKKKYGTEPDYPWLKYPSYAVLRHQPGRKWYGVLMTVPKSKLKIQESGNAEVLNLKCDVVLASFPKEQEILPAYHMNKKHWISVLLDGRLAKENVFRLIDLSFELTL